MLNRTNYSKGPMKIQQPNLILADYLCDEY